MEKRGGLVERKQHSEQSLASAVCSDISVWATSATCLGIPSADQGRSMRTGLLMVSVPVPLTHMAEFVCNLVKFNRCDPSDGFGDRLFCLV